MGYTGEALAPLFDPDLSARAAREMADEGGDFLLDRVKRNTPVSYHRVALQHQGHPVKRTPGTLRASWYREPVAPGSRRGHPAYTAQVATDDPVAPFVEWDTRPHIIRPKKPGGVLVFRVWPTGELVRAKMVRHPGTTGQHMMLLAANAAQNALDRICQPALTRWATRQVRAARRNQP
jgi:hypothetical protein